MTSETLLCILLVSFLISYHLIKEKILQGDAGFHPRPLDGGRGVGGGRASQLHRPPGRDRERLPRPRLHGRDAGNVEDDEGGDGLGAAGRVRRRAVVLAPLGTLYAIYP